MTALGLFGEERYRTIEESRIIELLLVHGWAFEVAAGKRAIVELAARAALGRCVTLGLPYRLSSGGKRLFDPVETLNFLKWAHFNCGERIWEDRCVATGRHQVWDVYSSGSGDGQHSPPYINRQQRFEVTIRRFFNLESHQPGDRVRLRLPLPIEDASLGDVSIEFMPPEGVSVDAQIAPARIDVVLTVPDQRGACIGVRTLFTARPTIPQPTPKLNPAEAALYTRPSEGLIKVSQRVRALADNLAGFGGDPSEVVGRFWTFMLDKLACGAIHYDTLDPSRPVDWVLEHGWYDCKVGSALMAALCRARQIPARLVTGYLLYVTAPSFHTWLEVWLDGRGWVPFDLMCWELSLGGRDRSWRDFYFGHVDGRMIVERLPRLFGGLGAVLLPNSWQMLIGPTERGTTIVFENMDSGHLVYQEHIEVKRIEQP